MKNRIVSSLCLGENKINELIKFNKHLDYVLEFSSGGFNHSSKNIEKFKDYRGKKVLHNYFPGYKKEPFVLNISSTDNYILEKSIDHCIRSIKFTSIYSDLKFFGVHAGFLVNLSPNDLGRKIKKFKIGDLNIHKEVFYESIDKLLFYAKKFKIQLLIENNVLIKENYKNTIPFFCVEKKSIIDLFVEFKNKTNYFGLLLDTAHLKVSSNTLNLDLDDQVNSILRFVKGIHHSDNNGEKDSNRSFDNNYWFLKYMNTNLRSIPNTLEVKNINNNEIDRMFNLLKL